MSKPKFERRSEIMKLTKAGKTAQEVASELGCSVSFVYKYRRDSGWVKPHFATGQKLTRKRRTTAPLKDYRFQMMMTPQQMAVVEGIALHAEISCSEAVRRLITIAVETQEAKRRQMQMLSGKEVGGINEIIRDLYAERAA